MVEIEDTIPVTERPRHPDGTAYHFNCCSIPEVREHIDGTKKCIHCGEDWTEALENGDRG